MTVPAPRLARIVHVTHPIEPWRAARFLPAMAGQRVSAVLGERRLPPATLLLRRGPDGRYAPVKRASWDDEALAADETALLVTLPQGGNQGSNPLAILAMIAVAALAAWAGPAAAAALGFAQGTTAFAVASAAISTSVAAAGAILVQAILPPPSAALPRTSTGLSPTYSLQAQANRARIGEAIPELFGRHIVFCDLGAEPWYEFVANEQQLYQVFVVGRGTYDIEQIRIGETIVWANGASTGTYPGLEIEIVTPGNAISRFADNVTSSLEVQGIELRGPNEANAGYAGPFTANPAGTRTNTLAVDVIFPGGLFEVSGSTTINASAEVAFEARSIDDAGVATGGWTEIIRETITRNAREPQRITLQAYVAPGRYEVRAKRISNRSTSSLVSHLVQWGTLRAFLPQLTTYGDTTVIAVAARASAALNGQSAQRFNVIATRKLPMWSADGGWAAPAATRSPAWAAVYALRTVLPDARIDLPAFVALAAGAAARGDTFDGVFDQQRPLWEVVQAILRVTRAQAVLAGSAVTCLRDEPRAAPRTAFTPRQIRRGSFSFEHVFQSEDSADSVIVEYIDSTTWNPAEIHCTPPGSPGLKPARVQMIGIANRGQAWREGQYIARASAFRRAFVSLSTELDGRVLMRGDLVRVSHPLPRWGQSADILLVDGDWLVVDAALEAPAGPAVAAIVAPDGRVLGPVAATLGVSGDRVRLDAPLTGTGRYAGTGLATWTIGTPAVSVWDGRSERPRLLFGTEADWARELLVVAARPSGADVIDVALVADDARVHADPGAPPSLPPPVVPPAVNLTIEGIALSEGGTPQAPELVVEAFGAADATSFDRQWQLNGSIWSPVEAVMRISTIPVSAGNYGTWTVRVRARTATATGPWAEHAQQIYFATDP